MAVYPEKSHQGDEVLQLFLDETDCQVNRCDKFLINLKNYALVSTIATASGSATRLSPHHGGSHACCTRDCPNHHGVTARIHPTYVRLDYDQRKCGSGCTNRLGASHQRAGAGRFSLCSHDRRPRRHASSRQDRALGQLRFYSHRSWPIATGNLARNLPLRTSQPRRTTQVSFDRLRGIR
jgi:hypothetical protein